MAKRLNVVNVVEDEASWNQWMEKNDKLLLGVCRCCFYFLSGDVAYLNGNNWPIPSQSLKFTRGGVDLVR